MNNIEEYQVAFEILYLVTCDGELTNTNRPSLSAHCTRPTDSSTSTSTGDSSIDPFNEVADN